MVKINCDDLTMENVGAWLEEKGDDAVAGVRGMFSSCPIAQFGKERWDIPATMPVTVAHGEFSVFPEGARTPLYRYEPEEICPLPSWTDGFMRRVDHDGGGDAWGKPIAVWRVKQILREVRDEYIARQANKP